MSFVPGSRIKGACLIEALAWLEKHKGRARLESALARMPAEGRAKLDPSRPSFGILASTWYEAAESGMVLDALTEGTTREERDRIARDVAKAVMEGTLRGVHGLMFSMMATPERYARHAPRLWSKYYDGGVVEVTIPEPQMMVGKIKEWSGHHPLLCAIVRFARVAALEAMGCIGVTSRHRCLSDVGGTECISVCRWTG